MSDTSSSPDAGATGATGTAHDAAMGDWPSPANHEWSAPERAWAPPSPPQTATSAEKTATVIANWQQGSGASWPAPRVEEAIVAVNNSAAKEPPTSEHSENVEPGQDAALADAIQRADQLLDELRSTVAIIGRTRAPDLSGVISELEVALTPPAALQPDDLAALRESLHSASERPRDIDTILDLTQRLGTLSSLMIAYDRSIAAIERSLDTLRGAESHDRPAWEA